MYKIKRFSLVKDLYNKFKLSYKSLKNRKQRHSSHGTEAQIKRIESLARVTPRLYSPNRKRIYDQAVNNRMKGLH